MSASPASASQSTVLTTTTSASTTAGTKHSYLNNGWVAEEGDVTQPQGNTMSFAITNTVKIETTNNNFTMENKQKPKKKAKASPFALPAPRTWSSLRKSYGDNITIHGVPKIINGLWSEKIFWLFLVIITSGCAVYITKSHWINYYEEKVNSASRSENFTKMKYPSITVCNWDRLIKFRNKLSTPNPNYKPTIIPSNMDASKCKDDLKCLTNKETAFGIYLQEAPPDYSYEVHLPSDNITFDTGVGSVCATMSGFEQKEAGKLYVITVLLNYTHSEWISYHINNPGEPFFRATPYEYYATTGYYSIHLYKKTRKYYKPYEDCVDDGEIKLKLPGRYLIVKHIGCIRI
jgi:hypothetical protein